MSRVATGARPIDLRLAESALVGARTAAEPASFSDWFAEQSRRAWMRVERVPLDALVDWSADPHSGVIGHRSGRFFTIEGLDVRVADAPVDRWCQPIIHQPEVGILGILAKEFDGVLHFLMQAKAEPGNRNGLQLSPTVQATRSNYTRVHGGNSVPYLHYFQRPGSYRVIANVRQSEQGSWFWRKRNRNVVVEVTEDVELLDGFCWLTLASLHRLLAFDDLINMDSRTVLSCLPFAGEHVPYSGSSDFGAALARSCNPGAGSVHSTAELLGWVTEMRTRTDLRAARVPLTGLPDWHHADGAIVHDSGLFFEVIGVEVQAFGREVAHWRQPMFAVRETGLVAFVVRRIGGVLHVLVQARAEPGFVDEVELAPAVQCTPANHDYLPAAARPRHLDAVLGAPAGRVRFDTTLSEEGGRFYHARTRYLIVEDDGDTEIEYDRHRWMTLHQGAELLRHSYYFNIQARSLLACLHSVIGR
ncbi:NDP-hexose 2,3-dehydratase family protein [Amycolatopsis oliviviridis]|uniref:NDP-hexose 2,3-dehydratase n=1 Tax=Amycolatopsis oliviviridis TaxID=1471590 RepID=A0ABQ3L357_9PSEU|nr:NDP-hexose 2,3-dehydratase family protein [Amycolatopsis oliviviridis]GHH01285.1 NDP-hexose 2,3-dehydratase [Amycolatopsis oliviviridis]